METKVVSISRNRYTIYGTYLGTHINSIPKTIHGVEPKYNPFRNSIDFDFKKLYEDVPGHRITEMAYVVYDAPLSISYYLDINNDVYRIELRSLAGYGKSVTLLNMFKKDFFILSNQSKELSPTDNVQLSLFSTEINEAIIVHQKILGSSGQLGSISINVYRPGGNKQ